METKAQQETTGVARSSDTEQRIRKVIAEVCAVSPGDIKKNSRLMGFGVDSLRVVELLVSVEEEFEVSLELGELDGVFTVEQLTVYVEGLLKNRTQD